MEDKFLISPIVYNQRFDMLVSADEEEFVRQAADLITKRIKKEIAENRIDTQTAALRVAMWSVVGYLKLEKQSSTIFELVSSKIADFEKRIDDDTL